MRSRLAIASGAVAATAGLALLASIWLALDSVKFFLFTAVLSLGLGLSAAAVSRRRGLLPIALLVVWLALASGLLALEWRRSDDAPGAGFGSALAASLALIVLAGGLFGVALDRFSARRPRAADERPRGNGPALNGRSR